jgi:hypothetical protein
VPTAGHFKHRSFSDDHKPVKAAVPKTTGISLTPAEDSDAAELVSIALFSGVGLLISLVVVIVRMYGLI